MPLPTNISDATRRLNPQIFGMTEQAQQMIRDTLELGPKKRIRQHQGDGLNKTERAFLAFLKIEFPNAEHFSQSFSLRLGNGASYRPDFISVWVLHPRSDAGSEIIRMSAWETKGFKREASTVRIKVAAARYQFIKFHLVTKQKNGGWAVEPVLP